MLAESWALFSTMVAGFFAMMNPIANTPVFLGLTDGLSQQQRRQVATRSLVVAFGVVVTFATLGQLIFSLFGITIAAFRLAGGIIVFLIGYRMLQGRGSRAHHTRLARQAAYHQSLVPPRKAPEPSEHGLSVAVSPLGVPLLSGPGTIVTAVGYSAGSWTNVVITIAAFLVLCVATWLSFVAGERLVRRLGPTFLPVITRLMGLILAVIGAQMFLQGLHDAGY